MVDPVNITNIDDSVVRRVDWARDSTLNKLVGLTDQQIDLLEKIAGTGRKSQLDTRNAQAQVNNLGDATGDAAEAAKQYERKLRQIEKDREDEARKQYLRESADRENVARSVGDLRNSLNNLSRTASSPSDAFDALTDQLALFGGRLSEKSGALSRAGSVVTMFSRALTVASFGLGAFAAGMPAFRQMLDSGISFGGSLEQMQVAVGRTGLGLQEFTNIALQYGTQISGMGEVPFTELVRQVQDTTRVFGRYGQTPQAQAESVGAFIEILSAGGSLYMMTEQQRTEETTKYLREQSALTKLTGISRKRLEDEQKQLMARTNVQLAIREMEARGDTGGAAQMRMMLQQVGAVLGPEMASAITGLQMGIIPQDPNLRRLLAASGGIESLQQMTSGMATSTPEQVRAQALAIGRQVLAPDLLRTLRIGAEVPGSLMGGAADLAARMGIRTDVALGRTPEQRAEVEDISAGRRGVLDAATTAYEQAVGDVARITGDFRSMIFTITQQLRIFSTALPAVAGATGGAAGGMSSIAGYAAQGVGSSALLAGGGILGYMAANRMLRGGVGAATGAATSAFTAPATPQWQQVMGGPGAMAGNAAPGAATAARGGVFRGMLGGAMRGMAGGAVGGLPGILIGAGLGVGSTLLVNYLTSGSATNAPTAAPMPMEARTGIQPSQMDAYWGSGSPLILLLKGMDEKMARVVTFTSQTATNTA